MDALVQQVAAMDSPTAAQVYRLERLKALKRQIEDELRRYSNYLGPEIRSGIDDGLLLGEEHSRRLVQDAFRHLPPSGQQVVMGSWNRLPVEAIETIVGMTDPQSALSLGMAEQLGPKIAQGIQRQLIEGVLLGRNPRKVAGLMRKEFGVGMEWALRNSRTSMLYAYREAARSNYQANDHVVKGWIWYAELDDRTCPMCIGLHGSEHTLEETLNDHYNGRCAALPHTFTYRELGIPVDEPRRDYVDGEAWLRANPQFQQGTLGKAGAEAFREGKFSLMDLVGEGEDPAYGRMIRQRALRDVIA